jgi:hypothetical protein
MPLFHRHRATLPATVPGPIAPPSSRRSTEELAAAEAHLSDFARSRVGVEAYIEPRTAVTDTTVVFIAASGEWTRRRVRSPQQAQALARALGIPAYDADVVGYPQRMRDWTRKRAEEDKRRLDGV